jgi:hypothetical protein
MLPAAPLQPLLELLHQMRKMIYQLDDVDYARPAPGRSSGGIGGHVRHCLDHVSALLAGTRTGVCAYDRRTRGTDVETSRCAAVCVIADLTGELLRLHPSMLDGNVEVETQIDPSGAMITTRSSLAREVAFVVSHTIHHNAIVGQMMQARGLEVGPRFGLAPSTPSEQESRACAR